MPEQLLVLTLTTDAIFTQSSATIGVPESHDAPPGGTLLGAVAAALYAKDPALAFRAVQLGALRISDGLPLAPGDRVALPSPLTWHTKKGSPPPAGEAPPPKAAGAPSKFIYDLSSATREADQQYSQLRGGWVVADGEGLRAVKVTRRSSMRTAIEEGGRAREGLLYGFEAVPAGQRYLVRVSSASPELLAAAVAQLCAGTVRIGRSRTAEFGEATLTAAPSTLTWPASGPCAGPTVRLLCVSDLALRAPESGQPTLTPTAQTMGLPAGWVLDLTHSAIRTRRYSPWNGHRQRPDLERQVITAGSVLVWTTGGVSLQEEQRAALERGVGEHTAAGLGQMIIEPAGLFGEKLSLREDDEAEDAQTSLGAGATALTTLAAQDKLAAWLVGRTMDTAKLDRTWAEANALAKTASTWGVPKSQWGALRALAQGWVHKEDSTKNREALLAAARKMVEEGVAGDAWGRGAKQLFGTLTRSRTETVKEVSAPQLGSARNPNHKKDGAIVTHRDNASNVHALSWSNDGALYAWTKRKEPEDVHFARAVAILARRAVRSFEAPASPGPKESK
jgi:hypothetical protein